MSISFLLGNSFSRKKPYKSISLKTSDNNSRKKDDISVKFCRCGKSINRQYFQCYGCNSLSK